MPTAAQSNLPGELPPFVTNAVTGETTPDALECLGLGLPAMAEQQLRLAGLAYHEDDKALEHLRSAWEAAPGHAAVYIGFYRFYFYKNRLKEALGIATECLKKAARDCGLSEDWRAVLPKDADFRSFEAIATRFFLFTLKGYGYLQMRLGNLDEGAAAISKLIELDPDDKLGGSVLGQVLARRLHGEDDD